MKLHYPVALIILGSSGWLMVNAQHGAMSICGIPVPEETARRVIGGTCSYTLGGTYNYCVGQKYQGCNTTSDCGQFTGPYYTSGDGTMDITSGPCSKAFCPGSGFVEICGLAALASCSTGGG